MSVFARGILRGVGFAFSVILLISAVLGLVALFLDIPDAVLEAASVAVLGVAAYSAAHRSTQINRSKGLRQGIVCGAALYLVIFVLSLAFSQFYFTETAVVKAAVCLIFGIIGGVVGINTKMTGNTDFR